MSGRRDGGDGLLLVDSLDAGGLVVLRSVRGLRYFAIALLGIRGGLAPEVHDVAREQVWVAEVADKGRVGSLVEGSDPMPVPEQPGDFAPAHQLL